MAFLAALIADEILRVGEGFSQDEEMSLMGRQTQHDQVCICAVDAVARVRVIVRLCSLRPDEVQDLVFTLTGYKRIGEEDHEVLPGWACVHLLNNVELESFGKSMHELGTRRDDIRVEMETRRFGLLLRESVCPARFDLLLSLCLLLSVFSCPESS